MLEVKEWRSTSVKKMLLVLIFLTHWI